MGDGADNLSGGNVLKQIYTNRNTFMYAVKKKHDAMANDCEIFIFKYLTLTFKLP